MIKLIEKIYDKKKRSSINALRSNSYEEESFYQNQTEKIDKILNLIPEGVKKYLYDIEMYNDYSKSQRSLDNAISLIKIANRVNTNLNPIITGENIDIEKIKKQLEIAIEEKFL